jgi:hypothetical protein
LALGQTEVRDMGGMVQPVTVNQLTGTATFGPGTAKTATPGDLLSAETTRRGQNMVDARARERLEIDRGTATANAGGPQQSALVKQFGKAAPGYRWKTDGSQEAIPGGPADIKAGELGAKADARKQEGQRQAAAVIDSIDKADKLTGYTTAGVGGLLANLPATSARDLRGELDTIKANLGFDRLQQMREMSPTGGALGAVAVQELFALQSTVASLDQLRSVPELKSALAKIRRHYTRWQDTLSGGAPAAPPAAGGGVVDWGSLK